jgi:hypothetical protein
MDNKFYVSYEAARLLKEKGYNNYSIVYDCSVEGDILLNQRPMYGEWAGDKDVYPCPSKAEAIDWLESKGIIIGVKPYTVISFSYFILIDRKSSYDVIETNELFPTRLEAEEAAIIKALESL